MSEVSEIDRAAAAHTRVGKLIHDRRFREAVEPASEVCRLRPDWAEGWWNYGVVLKHARRWAECLAACERAITLDPDDSDGPRWNAGIAATALGDWAHAREAWAGYGIDLPPGTGPLEMALGGVGIRLCPDDEPEVVFAERIDPCRAHIVSVPLAESRHRYGDIVLHDGEPRGTRRAGASQYVVFDELVCLAPSEYGTWQVTATCPTPADRDAMLELYVDVDGAIEDWTESVVLLCAACSLGEPCGDHGDRDAAWQADRRFGLALRSDRELRRLRRAGLWWRRGINDVSRVL